MDVCVRSIASQSYFLAVSFSFSPACLRLADFFFAVPSAWAYGFPVTLPAAFLALPLAASAVFLALSRLLIRISLLLRRCRIQHQRTQVGFPGPERPNQACEDRARCSVAIGHHEVVCGHGPQQPNFDPPCPLPGQMLDHPLYFAFLVDIDEERDVDGLPLMGRLV